LRQSVYRWRQVAISSSLFRSSSTQRCIVSLMLAVMSANAWYLGEGSEQKGASEASTKGG
jgi:hypothetical protein